MVIIILFIIVQALLFLTTIEIYNFLIRNYKGGNHGLENHSFLEKEITKVKSKLIFRKNNCDFFDKETYLKSIGLNILVIFALTILIM